MSLQLSLAGFTLRAAQAGKLRAVNGYPHMALGGASSQPPPPDVVELCEELQRELGVDVSDWEYAGDKTGEQTMNKLEKLLIPRKNREYSAEDFIMTLFELMLKTPHYGNEWIKHTPPTLEELLEEMVIKDSSSGYDKPGNPGGSSKNENALWAYAEHCRTARGYEPSSNAPPVYAVFSKGNEWLKKTKDQRKIVGESTQQNIALQACFGTIIRERANPFGMSMIGYKTAGNSSLQMLKKLSQKHITHEDIAKLEEIQVHASDKKQWEYTMSGALKALYASHLMLRVNWTESAMEHLLPLVEALGSYLHPLIGVGKNLVVEAEHYMPSGTYPTLNGNTHKHMAIVCDYVQQQLAKCDVDQAKELIEWRRTISILGDDFIARWHDEHSPALDEFSDSLYGTVTESEGKLPIGKAAFCQRIMRLENGMPVFAYNVERAKIKMCLPRRNMGIQLDAIRSLAADACLLGDDLATVRRITEPYEIGMIAKLDQDSVQKYKTTSVYDQNGMLRLWSPNHDVHRDVATAHDMANHVSMHPDIYDELCVLE